MKALAGRAVADWSSAINGPNGRTAATYYLEHQLQFPHVTGSVRGVEIYHPSRLNHHFCEFAFPRLKRLYREATAQAE